MDNFVYLLIGFIIAVLIFIIYLLVKERRRADDLENENMYVTVTDSIDNRIESNSRLLDKLRELEDIKPAKSNGKRKNSFDTGIIRSIRENATFFDRLSKQQEDLTQVIKNLPRKEL